MNPQWETQQRATCVVDFQTNDSYKSVRLVNQKHEALSVKYDSSNSNELTLFNKNKNIHEYKCECNQSWDSWTNDSLESFFGANHKQKAGF